MKRGFLAGFAFCALLAGCAGFSFRFYGLEGARYDNGKLLANSGEADDLPFTRCQPSDADRHPCVVMLRPEFFRVKTDYEGTQSKLKTAEKALAECRAGRPGS